MDTRSEKAKERLGERRSMVENRDRLHAAAKPPPKSNSHE
jgi:hypothetical protein